MLVSTSGTNGVSDAVLATWLGEPRCLRSLRVPDVPPLCGNYISSGLNFTAFLTGRGFFFPASWCVQQPEKERTQHGSSTTGGSDPSKESRPPLIQQPWHLVVPLLGDREQSNPTKNLSEPQDQRPPASKAQKRPDPGEGLEAPDTGPNSKKASCMKSPDFNTPKKDLRFVMARAATALTIIPEHYFIQESDPSPETLGEPEIHPHHDQNSGQQDDSSKRKRNMVTYKNHHDDNPE